MPRLSVFTLNSITFRLLSCAQSQRPEQRWRPVRRHSAVGTDHSVHHQQHQHHQIRMLLNFFHQFSSISFPPKSRRRLSSSLQITCLVTHTYIYCDYNIRFHWEHTYIQNQKRRKTIKFVAAAEEAVHGRRLPQSQSPFYLRCAASYLFWTDFLNKSIAVIDFRSSTLLLMIYAHVRTHSADGDYDQLPSHWFWWW